MCYNSYPEWTGLWVNDMNEIREEDAKYDAIDIARYMCKKAQWRLSNLQLQKMLFLTQMSYLGQTNIPLFGDEFEAWKYGPVVPALYHNLKVFGSAHVTEENFPQSKSGVPITEDIKEKILDPVVDVAITSAPWELVRQSHLQGGAWEKYYIPYHKTLMPKEVIRGEYVDLWNSSITA